MKVIRQSILEAYEKCPHMCAELYGKLGEQGLYESNDEEAPTNKYAMVGIVYHETMELWGRQLIDNKYRMSLEEMKVDLMQRFDNIDVSLFDNEEEREEYRKSLIMQLDYSYEKLCQTNSLIEVEYNFKIENMFNGLAVSGTIDRITGSLKTKNVHIEDYKTGRIYSRDKANNNYQVVLYALAFYKKFGFLPEAFVFHFTKHKRSMKVMITPDLINRVSSKIIATIFEMEKGNWEPNDKNKFFCTNFCSVQSKCEKMKNARKISPRRKKQEKIGWGDL